MTQVSAGEETEETVESLLLQLNTRNNLLELSVRLVEDLEKECDRLGLK